jgi:inosose dehydratase
MLEFDEAKASNPIGFRQMLDELVETGYTGTELGDWGYMPTEPAVLKAELARRKLNMLGAFVPVALRDVSAHDEGIAIAVKTASLLASVAGKHQPFLVLADANGTDPQRTCLAGRVTTEAGLSLQEWKTFTTGAERLASCVYEETGLRTVFHHHCAGYVETPQEIATFLEMTDPQQIGLVFDTGHFEYGAGAMGSDTNAFLERFAERIWYIHCKDCAPGIALKARKEGWDYFTALRNGIFCELGKGSVNFVSLLQWLQARDYGGYVVVEQDVLPGMGAPKESARRNGEYLRSIELKILD